MTRVFTLLAFSVLTTPGLSAGEMDGEWASVVRIRGGEQQLGTQTEAVIKDGKFNTVRNGELSELGTMRENIDGKPNQYTVTMTGDVADSGKSFNGIFVISADTMFTCVTPTPDARPPAEFRSTKEDGNILIVWMRKSVASKASFPTGDDAGADAKSEE